MNFLLLARDGDDLDLMGSHDEGFPDRREQHGHLFHALVRDRHAGEWARTAGLHAMLVLTLEERASRSDVMICFHRLMVSAQAGRWPSPFWNELACIAADLHPGEILGQLEAAYGDGLIDPAYVSRKELVKAAKRPVVEVLAESRARIRGSVTDAIGEMSAWACFHERPRRRRRPRGLPLDVEEDLFERDDPGFSPSAFGAPSGPPPSSPWKPDEPYRRDPATVTGRNDPCPCGSGKKFKQCHGK